MISALNKKFKFEIFNLGNNQPVNLLNFINILEKNIGKKANKNMLPMQPGDMKETYADISKSQKLLNFDPNTDLKTELGRFVEWYKRYFIAASG